jgi:hypothetical protein
LPLYKGGELVGGIGVSGDSVHADEDVAEAGALGFEPDAAITSETLLGIEYVSESDGAADCDASPGNNN